MISCKEHGHLKVWVSAAKIELIPADTERQLYESPTSKTRRRYAGKAATEARTLPGRSPSAFPLRLCPGDSRLLSFSRDRQASEVPLLECTSLQRARSLTGQNCVTALYDDEIGLETTKLSRCLLRIKQINTGLQTCHQAGNDSGYNACTS